MRKTTDLKAQQGYIKMKMYASNNHSRTIFIPVLYTENDETNKKIIFGTALNTQIHSLNISIINDKWNINTKIDAENQYFDVDLHKASTKQFKHNKLALGKYFL